MTDRSLRRHGKVDVKCGNYATPRTNRIYIFNLIIKLLEQGCFLGLKGLT